MHADRDLCAPAGGLTRSPVQTLIGEVDEAIDKTVDLASIRADPIAEIVH